LGGPTVAQFAIEELEGFDFGFGLGQFGVAGSEVGGEFLEPVAGRPGAVLPGAIWDRSDSPA
jgi:hypothetical protein